MEINIIGCLFLFYFSLSLSCVPISALAILGTLRILSSETKKCGVRPPSLPEGVRRLSVHRFLLANSNSTLRKNLKEDRCSPRLLRKMRPPSRGRKQDLYAWLPRRSVPSTIRYSDVGSEYPAFGPFRVYSPKCIPNMNPLYVAGRSRQI